VSSESWGALEGGEHGDIVLDLRHVIHRGLWKFNPKKVETLRSLFGDAGEPASEEIVRERLLSFLMAHDPGHDVNADPENLTETTKARLALFRAPEKLRWATLTDARQQAGGYARTGRTLKAVTADGVRCAGGLEWHVVRDLAGEISTAFAGTVKHTGAPGKHARPAAGPAPRIRYQPPTAESLDRGFWWRDTTAELIEELAELRSLTIVAAADGAADVGPPVHQDLFAKVLRDRALKRGLFATVDADRRDVAADLVVSALAKMSSPAQLGSIVRGLERAGVEVPRSEETALSLLVQLVIEENRSVDGFVADAIVELAFTAQRANQQVEIISAHFDGDITAVQDDVRERNPALGDIEIYDCGDEVPPRKLDPHLVPLMRIHGRKGDLSMQRLVVGEADFFAEEPVSGGSHTNGHKPRPYVVGRALDRGDVLFVGTSLTDLGMLSVVAAHANSSGKKYALLLPPAMDGDLNLHDRPEEYAIALDLLGRRYLHLGIKPAFVDFEQQVPQLLREVAHRIAAGKSAYDPYKERLARWWRTGAPLLGYKDDGSDAGQIHPKLRARGRERLREMRDVSKIFRGLEPSRGEKIRTDVWLRNPATRTLFHVATSAARPPNPDRQPLGSSAPTPEQRAFREGRTIVTRDNISRPGKYAIATPLILDAAPWHHLPVGIVSTSSNQTDGALAAMSQNQDNLGDFSTGMPSRLRALFDFSED
jgi:hypothetical protein